MSWSGAAVSGHPGREEVDRDVTPETSPRSQSEVCCDYYCYYILLRRTSDVSVEMINSPFSFQGFGKLDGSALCPSHQEIEGPDTPAATAATQQLFADCTSTKGSPGPDVDFAQDVDRSSQTPSGGNYYDHELGGHLHQLPNLCPEGPSG